MDDLFYSNMSLWLPALAAALALPRLRQRLHLSLAKHRSLAGHSRLAKRVARLIPPSNYDAAQFFGCDGASEAIQSRRRGAFNVLAGEFRQRYQKSLALSRSASTSIPDLQFTSRYRVPIQFADFFGKHMRVGGFLDAADGVSVTDLDGNCFLDLTGSYGVNVFGVDFYRDCLTQAHERYAALGPTLGTYHTAVASNVARLREISGLDAVSFHMSGTEAVMQAVRLARYHTKRSHLVRFCGAYHGWWEDVQPGIGNPLPPRETYTLAEMSEASLQVLRSRRDIACVLVNPLQALHPNRNAPSDAGLLDSSRSAGFDRLAYRRWLHRLREVCSERGIVLILDEVFVGFRLARSGAQEYFGVRADMVTYGKTLGGGLPIGVVCGRAELMQRYRDDAPVDVCLARGTFNAHPLVMCAMQAFLERLDNPEIAEYHRDAEALWQERTQRFNAAMQAAQLPIVAKNLQSIWTITYTAPSRYNWMLQFYLRREGLALSWVGTGRLIFSLNFGDDAFAEVIKRFAYAGSRMRADGWWPGSGESDRQIRRSLVRELAASWLRR